jgi:hypothetical protein
MGIVYRLESTPRLTVVVWDGTVTGSDWRAHVEHILADPDWPAGPLNLTDTTSVIRATITPEDMDDIVELYRPHAARLAGMRTAVVASAQFEASTSFGERMQVVGVTLVTFNAFAIACSWLGVDAGTVASTVRNLRDGMR